MSITRDEIEEFFGMIEDEGVVPAQHVHAMRDLALRDLALRGLEAGEPEILAQHSGRIDWREWHSEGTWLYPGEAIAKIEVQRVAAAKSSAESAGLEQSAQPSPTNPPPEHVRDDLAAAPSEETPLDGTGHGPARGAGTAVEEVRRYGSSPSEGLALVLGGWHELAIRHADELDRKTEEVAMLREKLVRLQANYDALARKPMNYAIIEDRAEKAKAENATLQKDLSETEADRLEWVALCRKAEAEVSALREKLAVLEAANRVFVAANGELAAEVEKLKAELAKIKAQTVVGWVTKNSAGAIDLDSIDTEHPDSTSPPSLDRPNREAGGTVSETPKPSGEGD